jgi:hypothetical protein
VRHLDRPAPDVHRRRRETLDAQKLEPDARAHDIHDCVNRADLMKVYTLDWNVVDARLGLRKPRENLQRAVFDSVAETRAAYYFLNIRKMTMMMLLSRQTNDGACGADTGAVNFLEARLVAFNVEKLKLLRERALLYSRADQCAERHIAADACEAVEVKSPHKELKPSAEACEPL